ncbi:MAG: serine hydrolase [Sphingomonas sp.]|uniref:serine hydrolase domain-containing protein n=1 Tax=Sphingomonas sp. TaxID=28214 RepID=UPI001B2F7484|nr:serine hydrolase [Sphingomonas sp.]MBO9622772.1 serine hydrolase [Sphingomonas sp.]
MPDRRTWLLAALAVPLGTAGAMPSDNPRATALDRAVDAAVGAEFTGKCHVGLSIAVVRGADTRFYDYGTASRTGARLPRPTDIYEIASVTKSFTGALAAKALVERRMTLDGDFRRLLPGAYPNLAWQGRPITLRTLAAHRSGLPRDIPDSDAVFARADYSTIARDLIALERGYGRRRYLAELHDLRLRTAPGEGFAYSNIGMKLIGFGLETAYGTPFDRLLDRAILRPLGMKDTGFAVPPASAARRMIPYGRDGTVQPYHLANAGAAYGLYSTAADMANYVRWHLDERDPVVRQAHARLYGSDSDGQALIWNLGRDGGERLLWHGGGTFGMSSQVVLYPHAREGYALLANDSCAGTEAALKQIALDVHSGRSADALGKAIEARMSRRPASPPLLRMDRPATVR